MRHGTILVVLCCAAFWLSTDISAQDLSPVRVRQLREDLSRFNPEAARRTVDDLAKSCGARYDAVRHRGGRRARA